MNKFFSYTLLTVATVNILGASEELLMTWTSPTLTKLYSNDSDVNPFDQPITAEEDSWIGSLITLGAMVGPFPLGFIAARFGRKIGLLSLAVPSIISSLILAFATNVYLYYFARLLGGIGLGGGYTLLPMYIAEVAEDSNRGMLTVTVNIAWTFGELIPYCIGPYMPIMWFNIVLACFPIAFFILFLIIAPESPYYLMIKNKPELARKSLMKLRSNNEKAVEAEIRHIQDELDKNEETVSLIEFFQSRTNLKALYIALTLIIAEQLSGIDAVLFYTQQIFEAAGVDDIPAEISSIIIGIVIFVTSFITPFLADRSGRRVLLLISLMGIALSHVSFGLFFYLKEATSVNMDSLSWLPIVSLVIFIVMYNVGLGSIPWTISSELFPTNVKSYAATLSSFACWTTSFFITKFFNNLQDGIGKGETFWLFGGCCIAAWFFTLFFLPETRGKSFQEIQEILDGL